MCEAAESLHVNALIWKSGFEGQVMNRVSSSMCRRWLGLKSLELSNGFAFEKSCEQHAMLILSRNWTFFPLFIGTGDIVAVMITESKVKEILNYLEKNISVLMAIAVGSRVPPKNFSRGSLVFVSISFIVLMIISSAWLIFYFIQKIRYTSARDRNQVRSLFFSFKLLR